MIFEITSVLLGVGVVYLIKKQIDDKNEFTKKYEQITKKHEQDLIAHQELQKGKLEAAETMYREKIQLLSDSYQSEIEMLKFENEDIKRNYRNRGEIITHQILENLKADLIRNGRITPDEMIIMPNIFIPEKKGNTRQIDHLILLSTGLYIIETKHWKGHIVMGMTKKSSRKFSFLVDLLDSSKEESIVFDRTESGGLTVRTYGNPISQVQKTAAILSNYLKKKNISAWINTVVFFNYDNKEVHDWSENSKVKRLINKEQLITFFGSELMSQKPKLSAEELQTIKTIIEDSNYLETV